MRTLQPAQLPQLQTIDVGGALQAYYMGKQRQRTNQMQEQQAQIQQMQLQEHVDNKPARDKMQGLQLLGKQIENDRLVAESIAPEFLALDPEDPDLASKAQSTAAKLAWRIHQKYGYSIDDASTIVAPVVAKFSNPEFLKQTRIQAGFESAPQKPSPATDIDDYVARANQESIRANGRELTPGEMNKAALEFKRAQAGEVYQNKYAEQMARANTNELVEYNEKLGQRLAEIDTAPALMEAKGEITPKDKKNNAKKGVSGELKNLAGWFIELDSMGSIINVDNKSGENIRAALRTSDPGQFFHRAMGSRHQAFIDSINAMKPLLLNNIRQASEMGARGLDSEKELEFYLQAATDEKRSFQTNLAAISVLDEAYGTGEIAALIHEKVGKSTIDMLTRESKSFVDAASEEESTAPQTVDYFHKKFGTK